MNLLKKWEQTHRLREQPMVAGGKMGRRDS